MRTDSKPQKTTTRKRPRAEQGAGLGDYLFGPSEEVKARVQEIRSRWEKLQAWGVAKKLPNTRRSQKFVETFLKEWESSPQVDKISAATSDVTLMERYAEEYDRKHGGSFAAAPIATPFDVERSSNAMKAAAAADKAATEAAAVVKDAANEAGKTLANSGGLAVPLVLAGAGLLVAVVVVAVKARAPRPQPVIVY